jgi:hypothetical protein
MTTCGVIVRLRRTREENLLFGVQSFGKREVCLYLRADTLSFAVEKEA